jgi:hypothetical protein
MDRIDEVLNTLSDEEVDLLNNDPQLQAAFKAKYGGQAQPPASNYPEQLEPGIYGETSPTGQKLLENAATAASGFAIPQAASAVAGLPGIRSVVQGGKNLVQKGANVVGDVFAPTVEEASANLLPALEKAGLKDIRPVIFNKGEREAAVQFAEKAAKLAEQGHLDPVKLQEARATIKDVLDNRIVQPTSPTGQIVSRSKDTITKALMQQGEQAGPGSPLAGATEALKAQGRAYEAQPTKQAISRGYKTLKRNVIRGALFGGGAALGHELFK